MILLNGASITGEAMTQPPPKPALTGPRVAEPAASALNGRGRCSDFAESQAGH
jgi:hypothetical protein